MKLTYIIVIILLFSGCQIDKDKKVDRNKFTFKTGDDTELFFKNVRQSNYDLEENEAAKFNLFRHEDRIVTNDQPVINLAIVNNYMNDEAYLLIEPNDSLKSFNPLTIEVKNDSTIKKVKLGSVNRESMLEFASQLFEGIQKNAQFFVLSKDEERIPILDEKEEREAFRITVSDYYRLTRVY